eukprot:TRINITY_DN2319_c0_g1_i2.p1 TRINITY_DN2319_c0_g1~~TRINITY_DN2319_c0_g1_i2.p1  ORF type:complete len:267 (+),score=90.52 TRINITY_DN2319_c0_g1_i2:88-888(+)
MNEGSVSSSILEFLQGQVPSIKAEDLDDILLDYVGSILKDLREDSSQFDVEEFYEMLVAYVPDCSSVSSSIVAEWLIRMASKAALPEEPGGSSLDTKLPPLDLFPLPTKDELGVDGSEGEEREEDESPSEFQEQIDSLSELFPYACQLEVVHCLSLSSGDIDKAAHFIMQRNETGQSFRARTERKILKPNAKPKMNEKELKETIVGKYGFIDKAEDSRYHRPTIKKADDKKLIRYRDGKIVSTKGERFTQIKKETPEEVRKTHHKF